MQVNPFMQVIPDASEPNPWIPYTRACTYASARLSSIQRGMWPLCTYESLSPEQLPLPWNSEPGQFPLHCQSNAASGSLSNKFEVKQTYTTESQTFSPHFRLTFSFTLFNMNTGVIISACGHFVRLFVSLIQTNSIYSGKAGRSKTFAHQEEGIMEKEAAAFQDCGYPA